MSENKERLYPGRLLPGAEKRKAFSHESHPIPNVLLSMYLSLEKKQEG
jgi:hypothetical protein